MKSFRCFIHIFKSSLRQYVILEYEEDGKIKHQVNKTLKIIGETDVSLGDLFLPIGSRDYSGNLTNLFQRTLQNSTVFLTFFTDYFSSKQAPVEDNTIIYIKNDVPIDRVRLIQKNLQKYGQVDLIADMIENFKRIEGDKNRKDFSNFVVLLLATIIGFLSVTILNVHKHLRVFSIWRMNGYSLIDIGINYSLYIVFIGIISTLSYVGLMLLNYHLDGHGRYYYYYITPKMIGMCALIYLSISMLISIFCLHQINRKGVLEYYHE